MVREQYRAALWVLVLIALVASSLSAISGARAGSDPTYTLTGSVEQPKGFPVAVNTQVDLVSRATGQVFTTTVTAGGQYAFTTANTGGALVPGYWGVWVPPQGNVSLSLCNPAKPYYQCAILPSNQTPVFRFQNATALTTSLYPTALTNITQLAYNGSLNGTVTSNTIPQQGAVVSLLDPAYNGFVFVNNTTSSSGTFHMNVPFGKWVLRTTLAGSAGYNLTQVTIANRNTVVVNPVVSNYIVYGYSNQKGGAHVPTAGNVTLWDPTNDYLYSSATPPGGFYSSGTYPAGFTSGSQSFDVILSSIGYGTTWFPITVPPASQNKNVVVSPLTAGQYGRYQTVLNFSSINTTSGKGSLWVNTSGVLGNNTVVPNLPNATVGQLWAQLGLDFDHSVTFSQSSLPAVWAFMNQTGPFFPAVQAQTVINTTGFKGPTAPQMLTNWSSTCSGTCGLSSPALLRFNWSQSYALNGTIPTGQSTYSIALGFAHPVSSSDVYNYTFVLPTGFVLAAGTQAPTATTLSPAGPGGTWTSFTLRSLPSPGTVGSAKFSIVKYSALTPIVNVTVSNFAFSRANVLNSTRNNYTVEVGVGQNVTFSALNSLYPAGTNGTSFAWVFGDGGHNTTSSATTNHTYTVASGSASESGTLTVTSSGGLRSTTKFFVWVAEGPVTANISVNWTGKEYQKINGVPYLLVNWSRVLQFNASLSSAVVSPSAKVPGVISVASFVLVSSGGFKQTANYSESQSHFWHNWSVQFLGAGSYLSNGTVGGNRVPVNGWQYNLTLTVWDGTGHFATASLVILVNDTEKPTSAFQVLTASGTPVRGTVVTAGSNLTAKIQLNAANASDPHNGSITKYYWLITNSKNTSVHLGWNQTTVKPYWVPVPWLTAATNAYTINLTVWDKNGNRGWATQPLTVSQNTTTSPIMGIGNYSIPSSYTDGTTYTLWTNVTVSGGSKAVATDVSVAFYLSSSAGSGSRTYIGGSAGPGLASSVRFYNYTSSGVLSSTPWNTPTPGVIPSLAFNKTVRAVVTWNPSTTGSFTLYVNATASNEFAGAYVNGPGTKAIPITIGPNPTTQLLEYAAIAVVVVAVLVLIVIYYRRRSGKGGAKTGTSRSGLERSKRPSDVEDDEDEDK